MDVSEKIILLEFQVEFEYRPTVIIPLTIDVGK
jgi:hypothetical protein